MRPCYHGGQEKKMQNRMDLRRPTTAGGIRAENAENGGEL
jgi:hypothetical protein